ncbi:MAG: STAS domain-containing protein [Actinomycetota bacterium]
MEDLGLVLRHEEDITYLSCRGVVTSENGDELNQALIMAVGTSPAELVLEMTRVTSIGFSGVIALLRAARWCGESEITLRLHSGPFVSDALDIAGLSWLLDPEEVPSFDRQREEALRDQVFERLVRTPYLT